MGKLGSGIGMTDVAAMQKALEAMHTCRVDFHLQTLGKDVSGRFKIVCDATFDVLPGSDLPPLVSVQSAWPNNAVATFSGQCYNLLWQLDYAIQLAYEQMTGKIKAQLPG